MPFLYFVLFQLHLYNFESKKKSFFPSMYVVQNLNPFFVFLNFWSENNFPQKREKIENNGCRCRFSLTSFIAFSLHFFYTISFFVSCQLPHMQCNTNHIFGFISSIPFFLPSFHYVYLMLFEAIHLNLYVKASSKTFFLPWTNVVVPIGQWRIYSC